MTRTFAVLLTLLAASQASGTLYTVQNTKDSGTRSLRWAIEQANAHVGRDVIRFAPRLSGRSIVLASGLPDIVDDQTIIHGDIDENGTPDVVLNGKNLSGYYGLELRNVGRCTIAGLVMVNFPVRGVYLSQSHHCTIRSCHVGVNLAGTRARRSGTHDIYLYDSHYNTVGGASAADRNVIAGGGSTSYAGVGLTDSNNNIVSGNYIGTTRDGMYALGDGGTGVRVTGGDGNVIGGTTDGERNLFGGLGTGVTLIPATNTVIAGNYFGLAADGDTVLPIRLYGVLVTEGATGNRIGGTAAGARNAFAGGADVGVLFRGVGTESNRVQGNYFGLNASGTQQRRLETGVKCHHLPSGAAGPQTIGGNTAAAGNYFTPKTTGTAYGVRLGGGAGAGSAIKHNTFGVRPDGRNATGTFRGVSVWEVVAYITDNRFVGAERAIESMDVGAHLRVYRNRFRNCEMGVAIGSTARCRLGNLGNASTGDDGGNVFRRTGLYHIRNWGPDRVPAEGNDFGTTSRAAIDAMIWDRRDDPDVGRVDFSPLIGGVLPTGANLVVTGATAMPTAAGAQIVFTVSAPASVTATVRSLAGRPVRTLCRARDCEAGSNTLSWNARSDRGVSVPSGTYLVELLAASPDGGQARALTAVRIER
jgi:hypothetical protein